MSANSSIFGTFARTHPISLKLYQNIEDVILIKNHEKKIGNNYGHLAIIGIWNLKNWQNFKNCENFKSVRETWNFFSWGNFHRRFRIWAQNWRKFRSLTRERLIVHFSSFFISGKITFFFIKRAQKQLNSILKKQKLAKNE